MPSYCLKCVESIILQISGTINDGIILLPKCVVCGDKKSIDLLKTRNKMGY